MQEAFGRLFWAVTGLENGAVPLAVWHSTPSDRTQREMLRAAAKAACSPSILKPPRLEGRKASKRALDDVLWALDKAEALAPAATMRSIPPSSLRSKLKASA